MFEQDYGHVDGVTIGFLCVPMTVFEWKYLLERCAKKF